MRREARPLKVVHCITNLWRDGAQRMLYRLVTQMDKEHFAPQVISMKGEEPFADEFRQEGIAVTCLGFEKNPVSLPRAVSALRRALIEAEPDVVQGWMYHANLCVSLAPAVTFRSVPTLWNIRSSLHDRRGDKVTTKLAVASNIKLSPSTSRIIYCTSVSADQHEAAGFDRTKRVVIGNGFDVRALQPSEEYRQMWRSEWQVPDSSFVVGIVGRYHDQKDFPNFLRAAGEVLRHRDDVVFVMAGRNLTPENENIAQLIKEQGLEGKVRLLGERTDVPTLLPAFDVYCSSSCNEGFPNVVGEAMACGACPVVTDVGASREIVEGLGVIVPPSNSAALGGALLQMLDKGRDELARLGAECRRRILERYALPSIVKQYENVYLDVSGRLFAARH